MDEDKFVNGIAGIMEKAMEWERKRCKKAAEDVFITCPYPPMSFQAAGYRHACNQIISAILTPDEQRVL